MGRDCSQLLDQFRRKRSAKSVSHSRNEVLSAHLVGNAETPAGFKVKRARDPRKGAKRSKGDATTPGSINRRLIASLSMSSRCIGP